MPYILDISTAVPDYSVTKKELAKFYSNALDTANQNSSNKKINFLSEKTKIDTRYSCIPDFNDNKNFELFFDENYKPSVEKRTQLYKEKVMSLAGNAIDSLLAKCQVKSQEITHLITVSCTGLVAPGFEFLVSEKYNLQHTEKLALNFLGCYAAIKAIKQANYIAQANPKACVLIICVELCTLHFYPSNSDEDIISNLLFADGASAAIVCGNHNEHIKSKLVLNIDAIGSACIPNTLDLMTWNISSTAFRMYLSKNIVNAIKDNINAVTTQFLGEQINEIDYWAIHPGGIRIVEAVKESLKLSTDQVDDSIAILQHYGNMSSPTILFILNRIINKLRAISNSHNKKIVACAFGPGLSIEMLNLTSSYQIDN